MKRPDRLHRCHSIADLRELARRRLPAPIFHHVDGGAESEVTARRNMSAFDDEALVPRCLVDVSVVNTATRILGQDVAWPVFCSPTGASRFCHPDGELAVARAAAKTGTLYALSTTATYSLEEVAGVGTGPRMFQLYIFKDRGVTAELIQRCKQAGYTALCLTVDAPVIGKRERDLRSGWGVPINLSMGGSASFALHPRWLFGQALRGRMSMPTLEGLSGSIGIVEQTQYLGRQLDSSVTWKDVGQLIDLWGSGPFAIKGVMSVDDARRAAEVGASAVIVSNHGGRQLDGAAASMKVLPGIASAVGDRLEVILDGGIRRGVHALKALSRGAKACSIGRPYLYGLAAGGEQGVSRALEILRTEFVRAMQLSGIRDVADIGAANTVQRSAGRPIRPRARRV
jgi:L-lactate dehydrogenase (cytochrome)